MGTLRKPYQGLVNVVRFNWPFYLYGILFISFLYAAAAFFHSPVRWIALLLGIMVTLAVVASLCTSWYVYDLSGLYRLGWLSYWAEPPAEIANINAGFDEISGLLANKFPEAGLKVFDFYDATRHTEPSIRRARNAYPPYPGTIPVEPGTFISYKNRFQLIVLCFAAHEVRNEPERIHFFTTLSETLAQDGTIVVVEHLRDLPNFLAYNIGFFHFHSRASWQRVFKQSGLILTRELPLTPLVNCFYLSNNGTSA